MFWLAVGASIARGQPPPASFTPLNDLGAGLYLELYQGGLYPHGSNEVPAAHAAEGLRRATAIQPLNALGQPSSEGKYVFLSIGMSNTNQEFTPFVAKAAANPAVNHAQMVIVNGAQGGQPAEAWVAPDAATYDRVADRLAAANVTEAQVAAVWLKQANPGPTTALPSANADAFDLMQHLGDIVRAAKVRYPNLQVAFLSSRIYAGYASTMLNPEPYAYESGLAVKWLVEAQIDQLNTGATDPLAGDLDYRTDIAPWLAWGPYLWADGLHPRSDGLIWEPTDFAADGTHPSPSGADKVATMLLDFMLNSPFTRPWFLADVPGDYNADGRVDAGDYVRWRNNLGDPTEADIHNNGDGGDVGISDYAWWKARYGNPGSGSAGPGDRTDPTGRTVPEPLSIALLVLGVTLASLPLWRTTRSPVGDARAPSCPAR